MTEIWLWVSEVSGRTRLPSFRDLSANVLTFFVQLSLSATVLLLLFFAKCEDTSAAGPRTRAPQLERDICDISLWILGALKKSSEQRFLIYCQSQKENSSASSWIFCLWYTNYSEIATFTSTKIVRAAINFCYNCASQSDTRTTFRTVPFIISVRTDVQYNPCKQSVPFLSLFQKCRLWPVYLAAKGEEHCHICIRLLSDTLNHPNAPIWLRLLKKSNDPVKWACSDRVRRSAFALHVKQAVFINFIPFLFS